MPKVVPEYRDEARRRIVEAGLAVMAEQGYHRTTMDEIAARLGVSKGALYLYFRRKEDLLLAVTAEVQQRAAVRSREAFTGVPLLEGFRAFLDTAVLPDRDLAGLFFELIALSAHDPVVRDCLTTGYDDQIGAFAEAIAAFQQRGAVRSDLAPAAIADALVSAMHGLRVSLALGVPEERVRAGWDATVRGLLTP